MRAQLGYQFSSDRSGVVDTLMEGMATPDGPSIKLARYLAPLSYQSHLVALSLRFILPWRLSILAGASVDPRFYAGVNKVLVPDGSRVLLCDGQPLAVERRDVRYTADLAARRELPWGFGVEIGYTLLYNVSTVRLGSVDNRNYEKHGVSATVDWSF